MNNLISVFAAAVLYMLIPRNNSNLQNESIQEDYAASTDSKQHNSADPSQIMEMLCRDQWVTLSRIMVLSDDATAVNSGNNNSGHEIYALLEDHSLKFCRDGILQMQQVYPGGIIDKNYEKYYWFYQPASGKICLVRDSIAAEIPLRYISENQLVLDLPGHSDGVSQLFTATYVHPVLIYP